MLLFIYDKAIYWMSNNIFFFERIYTVSVHGVENWIATVEMSFRITTYRKCRCQRDYIPRDERTRAPKENRVMSVAYDTLWYHNASPVRVQICFAFDVSCNIVTGIRILSSLFGRRRNSQRCWSTFRNGRCQRLHSALTIAEIRLFRRWMRKYGIVTFQNSFRSCQNLASSMELLRSHHNL